MKSLYKCPKCNASLTRPVIMLIKCIKDISEDGIEYLSEFRYANIRDIEDCIEYEFKLDYYECPMCGSKFTIRELSDENR